MRSRVWYVSRRKNGWREKGKRQSRAKGSSNRASEAKLIIKVNYLSTKHVK